MNLPIYSAMLAAFLVTLNTALMMAVGVRRFKGPFLGTDGDKDMERRVRRHGNLVENAGLLLAAIAILELLVGQTGFLATLCVLLAAARTLHALGFSSLAGSHGEDLGGSRTLFAVMRGVGAFGTVFAAIGTVWGLVTAAA